MSTLPKFATPYSEMADTSQDPERLEHLRFHLESGDYFPFLSTVFSILEEGVQACGTGIEHAAELIDATVIENLRKDLIYLHKHYSIQPKSDV